jgi:hypothetical protein
MDWEFEKAGQKVQLTLDGVLAVNDQDANIVAGLMGIGIAKVANYMARPYLESGQLKHNVGAFLRVATAGADCALVRLRIFYPNFNRRVGAIYEPNLLHSHRNRHCMFRLYRCGRRQSRRHVL